MRQHKHNLLTCLAIAVAAMALPSTRATAVDSSSGYPTTPGSSITTRHYIIEPNDELDIDVDNHPELKASVTVLPDGTISYGGLGLIRAAGLTVPKLTDVLVRGLSDTINTPTVTVVVHTAQLSRFSVLGAVKQEGLYDAGVNDHALDAIAAAGGLAQDPSLTDITLVSNHGTSTTTLDAVTLMDGSDPSQNAQIQAGDVLLVRARNLGELEVQVAGEVSRPGNYSIPAEGITVMSVLNRAGGALPDGALTRAQILHNGKVSVVDLQPATQDLSDPSGNILLFPGDVLQIPQTTAHYALLGAVHSEAIYDVPDGGSITISQAIATAGGTTDGADTAHATLLRKTASGDISTTINVDSILRGRPGTDDSTLQAGDVLYIPQKSKNNNLELVAPAAGVLAVLHLLL